MEQTGSSITTKLRRSCRTIFNIPHRPYAMARLHSPEDIFLLGRSFKTHPRVFNPNPACFRSTEIFIKSILELSLKGKKVLDMGTGSGAIGIFAAAAGADVIACDINPEAVTLARENAALHGMTIDVRHSNFFGSLDGEKFDYIFFNIPFYPKVADNYFEMAFNAGKKFESVHSFAESAIGYLNPSSKVVIIFSEDSGYWNITDIFVQKGFNVLSSVAAYKHFEKFFIVTFDNLRS